MKKFLFAALAALLLAAAGCTNPLVKRIIPGQPTVTAVIVRAAGGATVYAPGAGVAPAGADARYTRPPLRLFAEVLGENGPSQEVTWTLEGTQAASTIIDPETGALTIAAGEAGTLIITAASVLDPTVSNIDNPLELKPATLFSGPLVFERLLDGDTSTFNTNVTNDGTYPPTGESYLWLLIGYGRKELKTQDDTPYGSYLEVLRDGKVYFREMGATVANDNASFLWSFRDFTALGSDGKPLYEPANLADAPLFSDLDFYQTGEKSVGIEDSDATLAQPGLYEFRIVLQSGRGKTAPAREVLGNAFEVTAEDITKAHLAVPDAPATPAQPPSDDENDDENDESPLVDDNEGEETA
ncbi:MAG: hypothetical protein LBR16_01160 [Treponema sp.]|jgi:hypothetical protein|nr:hypothetical protein [Treponema sp.]